MQFEVIDLGLIDYKSAERLQKEILCGIKDNSAQSTLFICRHYPVITLGRSSRSSNILISAEELRARNIEVANAGRAGDVTYHGPGQLTAYPVFNLNNFRKDIHFYLRKLEDVVINFLGDCQVTGQRRQGLTGVWANNAKISSIGIAIRNWISFHGVSVNIKKDDLVNFQAIRPCGMDIQVTSLESCLGEDIEIGSVKKILVDSFKSSFLS
jgi:lipoate-protein ligase B